jgi:hypothetical protein
VLKGVLVLNVGSKWIESHESDCPLSFHHPHLIHTNLRQHGDNMKWRNLLSVPKRNRRTRSTAGSELGSTEASSEADPDVPGPAELTPDLRACSSTLPTSTPPTPCDQESGGMGTAAFLAIHLTILCDIASDDPTRSTPTEIHLTVDPIAVHENKSSWKSTAYSTTKLAINMVKEASDVFPPLKSVVGGLSVILQHCDVRFTYSIPPHPQYSLLSQQTMACRQTIESLMPRVEWLAESLSAPAPEGEVKEEERRTILKR